MPIYVSVIVLVLACAALVAAYLAMRTLAKLRRATALLSRGVLTGEGKRTLIELTQEHAAATTAVAADLERLRAELAGVQDGAEQTMQGIRAQILDDLTRIESDVLERAEQVRRAAVAEVERGAAETEGALRHTALLRYDAFPGMSGRLSFSLALLDETGTGVAISALAGHGDTRVYAKGIAAGRGEHQLTPEEAQAVTTALSGTKASRLARRAS
ncbi:MAG TPA: DUF4446 family protein [Jatrophihabitans sp.]|jgi:hypothetical protein